MKTVLIMINGTIALYRFRIELLEELIQREYRVVVSSPVDGFYNELNQLDIQLLDTSLDRHGTNLFREAMLIVRYYRILKTIKPDIILGYTIKPNIYGNLAASWKHIPMISTISGLGEMWLSDGVIAKLAKQLYRISMRHVKCVVFQNAEDLEIMKNSRIIKNQNSILVAGSGINLHKFTFEEMPKGPKIRFLYSGRLMKSKGIQELLAAAKQLGLEFPSQFEVVLAGYDEEDFTTIISREKDIRYIGFQENISQQIQDCHCVVLPSYKEGMSNALLEAAATGRPLIASDVSGCREIIEDGLNGYLCKPRDVESLYICMKRFLKISHQQRCEMGREARKKVAAEFNRETITNTICDMVDELIGQIK